MLMVLIVWSAALAQTSLGTITGVVSDPKGAVIANATVTATNDETSEKHSVNSTSLGAYRIDLVSPGTYTIAVKAAGFSELRLQKVLVTASVITTANANLQIGVAETIVEVAGVVGEVQTEDGALNNTISQAEITQLPVGTLNPIQLALTEPGVTRPTGAGFSNGFDISVNGVRSRGNNFLIEGQDNNDAAIQGQALQVINLEALKEVSIQTNSYSAEFGHGGGSVTNLIYKSGTNTWHGSVFDLLQNSALNTASAADKLNGTPKAPFRDNTFGFTVGGPIQRDKLFAFGSIQFDRTRQTANGGTLTIPTANGIAALQSLPANARITELLSSVGTLRGTSNIRQIQLGNGRPAVEVGQFQRSVGEPTDDGQYVAKGDWTPTSNDTVSLRYVYDHNRLTPDFFNLPNQLLGFDTQQGGSAQNAGITYTRSFTAHVINEFRASYGRIGFSFIQTPQTQANPLAQGPTIGIGGISGFGAPGGIPQSRFHNTFQYQDTVSWNKGNHSFKFGADISRIQVRDGIPFNNFGSLTYASGGGFSALANFIDDFSGRGGSATIAFGSPTIRPRFLFENYFALDSWKLRPNLTVTYGVRYENQGTPGNAEPFPAIDHTLGAADPLFPHAVKEQGDNTNFAPRVSFAYSPYFWDGLFGHGKTVFRAGFGIFYDQLFTNIVDNTAAGSPNVITPTVVGSGVGRGQSNLSGQFAGFTPVLNPRVGVTTIIDNLVQPKTLQFNFDIERELGAKTALTLAYVGTRGEHLFANDQFNPIDPNTGLRVVPTRGPITVRDNSGDSIYHAFQLKVDRRFTNGLQFRTSYTFSKLIDDASEVFAIGGGTSFPADLQLGHRGIDRGLSYYDHRNAVAFTYIYDLPKLKAENVFAKGLGYVVNGFQTSGTATYQNGNPQNVIAGFDANGDGQVNDRPDLLNPNAPLLNAAIDSAQLGLAGGQMCELSAALTTGVCDPFVNGTATIQRNAAGRIIGFTNGTPLTTSNVRYFINATGVGNLGRNAVVVPGRSDLTFALQRTINLHSERQQLVFRMEMFNPFNHPFTQNPPYSLAGINFIPCTLGNPGCTAPTQTFGNAKLTETGNRDIRFKLRYQF
jgi:hypothetical protein